MGMGLSATHPQMTPLQHVSACNHCIIFSILATLASMPFGFFLAALPTNFYPPRLVSSRPPANF